MPLTIDPSTLPAKQFTAGSILKQHPGAKLADVRTALDSLVDAGALTVKVAGSGARNYKPVKGKVVPPAEATTATDDEWEASATTPPAPVVEPSTDKVERVKLAKAEAAALKDWQRQGENGPRPSTSNLDAIAAKAPTTKATTKAKGTGQPRGTTVQFVVDGKAMPASQNKLSSVAWYHTKGIGGDDVARIGGDALRQLLVAEGIADPSNTAGWSVVLPNGKTLNTVAMA